MKFFATDLYNSIDNEIHIIGFRGEDEEGEPLYFMLQDALHYDEQDEKLGMATYHIERNSAAYGCYGGIAEVEIKRDLMRFEFDEEATDKLHASFVEVEFSCDDARFVELAAAVTDMYHR